MNVNFKVYWNNPIEMSTEAGTQQLTFEVPLGAIISNPSSGGGTASYPSFIGNAAKVLTVNATEDDVEWKAVSSGGSVSSVNGQTGVVVLDADAVGATTQAYVDQEVDDLNSTLSTSISSKADTNYVDTQDTSIINSLTFKADTNYVDTQDGLLQDQIDLKADAIAMNQVLSTKADLVGGVIPSFQLPSYVDDVLSFVNLASFPVTGEDGKIYIAEDVNKTYRWSGSSYVEIGGGGVALGETSSTAYRGDRGKIAYDHSQSQGNPHNTTTSDITEGTKLFFTESRVNQTILTGLNTNTATPALATDQLLAAIGKLQAQINNIAPPVWVNAASIGTTHAAFTGLQFAKINGLLWVRGNFNASAYISADTNLFLLTNLTYRLDIPPTFLLPINLGEVLAFDVSIPVKLILQLRNVPNSANYFSLNNETAVGSGYIGVIQPTAIGRLLTP